MTLSSPSSSSFTTGPPSLPTSNVFFAMSLFFVHGNEADGVSVSSATIGRAFSPPSRSRSTLLVFFSFFCSGVSFASFSSPTQNVFRLDVCDISSSSSSLRTLLFSSSSFSFPVHGTRGLCTTSHVSLSLSLTRALSPRVSACVRVCARARVSSFSSLKTMIYSKLSSRWF